MDLPYQLSEYGGPRTSRAKKRDADITGLQDVKMQDVRMQDKIAVGLYENVYAEIAGVENCWTGPLLYCSRSVVA